MEQQGYLTDPLTLTFQSKIIRKSGEGDGQVEVILDRTYFYPTGGGQPHDTGTLGGVRVLAVFKNEAGQVVHRLEREPAGPVVIGRIDPDRRLGHMRHHSAQHILSGALAEVLGLETVSVKISVDSPSTADVPEVELSWPDLVRVEQRANQLVFENRPIKSYFITDDRIGSIPFRRPPLVTGKIRVVEVDSFDYSACGGTHCPTTGMIGLIKILKRERKNKKLRLHFVAGTQALAFFQQYHQVVSELGHHLSTAPEEVVELVKLQSEQLQVAQREIKNVRNELMAAEAEKLAAGAEAVGSARLVTRLYPNRSPGELRELAKLLQQPGLIALVAGYDGQKLALVVSCGQGTGVRASQLLQQQLAPLNGRGGGDDYLAQGGGPATEEQVDQIFAGSRPYVRTLMNHT